ncbi:hypothetical protein D3C76_1391490 [compost metagenome]
MVGFAGNGHVGTLADPHVLHAEHQQREHQQHHAQRTGCLIIKLRTGNVEVDLRGQYVEVAAEDQRVTEVRQRLNNDDQERVGQCRFQQRHKHLGKGLEAVGAQRVGRLFQRRMDGLDRPIEDHE